MNKVLMFSCRQLGKLNFFSPWAFITLHSPAVRVNLSFLLVFLWLFDFNWLPSVFLTALALIGCNKIVFLSVCLIFLACVYYIYHCFTSILIVKHLVIMFRKLPQLLKAPANTLRLSTVVTPSSAQLPCVNLQHAYHSHTCAKLLQWVEPQIQLW